MDGEGMQGQFSVAEDVIHVACGCGMRRPVALAVTVNL